MTYRTGGAHGIIPPGWLWFVVAFLVAAVLVARSRPALLLPLWLGACVLAVAGTLIWIDSSYLRYAPVRTVAEIVLANGIPTGLTTLWLHQTRRNPVLSRTAVQLASALAVFMCGFLVVAIAVTSVYVASR